jgi:hypothetical protein
VGGNKILSDDDLEELNKKKIWKKKKKNSTQYNIALIVSKIFPDNATDQDWTKRSPAI